MSSPADFYAEVGGAATFDKIVSRFYQEVAVDPVRLDAPLSGQWKTDGWPLVRGDGAVNPAVEALEASGAIAAHLERSRVDPLPVDANAFWSPHIENLINNVIWFVPWQTVHFFGYSIVFGTVLAVVLRIFGFWKSVPFSAVHRILPLGVFGVAMNVFTGMLMLMADTFRYVNEITFVPKMFFLPIGAIAVLYFSLSDRLFRVKAGEDAPVSAKWVAALLLVSWVVVIMGGRLLPYV